MASSSLLPNALGTEMKRERSTDSARRRTTMTSQGYQDAVLQRAERSQYQTLHAGLLFRDLAEYLQRPSTPELSHPGIKPVDPIPYATVVTMGASAGLDSQPPSRESYSNPRACVEAIRRRAKSESQVIFLRGYPSPEWIKSIGACCRIEDAEFFRWHLRFQCRQKYCLSQPLFSTFSNIIRLKFITIGSRQTNGNKQETVDKLREKAAKAMKNYEQELKIGDMVKAGDSIIRDYHVLDEQHVVIEQEMSICITKSGSNWTAVVLTDVGKDVSTGPKGPWASSDNDKSSPVWKTLYPTILPLTRSPSKKSFSLKDQISHETYSSNPNFQTAFLLPEEFGTTLDVPSAKSDPFYALNELFKFSVSSEHQFLNLIEKKISLDAGLTVLKQESPTLANLLYFQEILESHISRLEDNIATINDSTEFTTEQSRQSMAATKELLRLFEDALKRATTLKSRCEKGMAVIMNNAMLAETRRSVSQANGVAKLTFIAFFYIPLSFVCSFFGMNFEELGTGKLSLWTWFATSIPIFAFTLCFIVMDGPMIKRLVERVRRRFSHVSGKKKTRRGSDEISVDFV